MEIRKLDRSGMTFEYNLYAQRNFPWHGVVEPPFGGAWAVLPPGETSTPHKHDEKEVFMIVKGVGQVQGDDQNQKVTEGDLVYFKPYIEHSITNVGKEDLEFICIWWGGTPKEEYNI